VAIKAQVAAGTPRELLAEGVDSEETAIAMASNDQAGSGPDPSHLAQTIARLSDQLASLHESQTTDREAHRAQIQMIYDHLSNPKPSNASEALLTPNTTSRQASPPPIRTPKKKTTLPDPPKFDGTRNNFRAWYLEMQNKLLVDGEVIGGDRDRFAYIFSRLEKTPQSMTVAYVERGGNNGLHNPTAYLAYLHSCYGDPNAQARALDRLRGLRQRTHESFAAFLPKFEKELADGGGAEWTDAVRINYLEGAINDTMRDRLISVTTLPTEYPRYIQALQTIGSRLDSLNHARKQAKAPHSRQPSPPSDQTSTIKTIAATVEDKMDWEPIRVAKAVPKEDRDRHLQGKRAKWVDQAELDRRRAESRCFRCGRSECRVERCPLKPAKRPNTTARKAKPKPVTEAAVEEDNSSDQTPDGSENE